jgi:uncharacterized protein YqjF (DUF2071 family)
MVFAALFAIGFRSARSTPAKVAEMALSHAIGDKVEAAYRRGDLLEKRVALMADWAAFLTEASGRARKCG